MQVQPRYPNVGAVVCDLLSTLGTTVTRLPPAPLPDPCIRVTPLGGPMDIHQTYARVDVEVFSADYDTAWNTAGDAVQVILAAYRKTVNGVLIDSPVVPNGLQAPFYSQDTFRVQFEATLILRRSGTS